MSLERPPISDEFKDAVEHRPLYSAKSPKPFSLRLSAAEKAELLSRAGSTPLGAYIRSQLLENGQSPRRARKSPIQDERALAKLLGELGKAKLANNLNQLARAANSGSLATTKDTEQALAEACREVRWMRDTLMLALGLRIEP